MKIRSITYFFHPDHPSRKEALAQAGRFIREARAAVEASGYAVETVRLATPPFPIWLDEQDPAAARKLIREFENQAAAAGFTYISLGPALPDSPESFTRIPGFLEAAPNTFFSGMMTTPGGGISLPAVRACARVIERAAALTPDGFTNLRFTALANVQPGSPFFPAAYHSADVQPAFALATAAADLAVEAFTGAPTLQTAQQRLREALEMHARRLVEVAQRLEKAQKVHFYGIDFSLAPFPEEAQSLGTALQRLGIEVVGMHGSLAAAALIASTLDQANFPHTGFSGLMLPVLEDSTLARAAALGTLTVKDLLLYSAVCGTGLDTIPLPGDTTADQIAAVLLDVAALAQRLDKPLTARLMPVPGKLAGDPTEFEFAYFANSRVMPLEAAPLSGAFLGGDIITLQPRKPGENS
ncbi:MAG: DUF711 family protein [Chloroflexi bacterium]|nr:DUF711 family protein [Chloroflexota bacterium]